MMEKKIRIKAGQLEITAELNDTKTAQAVWEALPINNSGQRWGDEIYFSIPVSLELENGQESVNIGDIGYWPPGQALCIFFGPTPASTGNEIRPASAVTVLGKVAGNTSLLKKVKSGTEIIIEKSVQD